MQENNVFGKFYFWRTFFLIASYQILQNDAILINHFFKKKILYSLTVSNFLKWINYYQIQKIVFKNFVLEISFWMLSVIKEFIFKNWGR